jgi:uncharacterized protein (TIGR00725 family)
MPKRLPVVGVLGSGSESHEPLSGDVGRLLARLGVHLLTGGGSGAMLAASQAFAEVERRTGLVIGVLPCRDDDPQCCPKPGYPNPFVEIAIATHLPLSGVRGMQQMSRNHINVLSSDVLVALPGGQGTVSEVMLALRYEKPVVAYLGESGSIPGLPASVPVARSIDEVDTFVRGHLSSLRAAQGV